MWQTDRLGAKNVHALLAALCGRADLVGPVPVGVLYTETYSIHTSTYACGSVSGSIHPLTQNRQRSKAVAVVAGRMKAQVLLGSFLATAPTPCVSVSWHSMHRRH